MRLHLLEPYRSALVAQGIKEGLVVWFPAGMEAHSSAVKPATPALIAQTLELAVLHDSVSIVWNEVDRKQFEKEHLPYMIASGLQSTGCVQFVPPFELKIADVGSDVKRWWAAEKDNIDAYKEMILTQLAARGHTISRPIFNFLRAVRLDDFQASWNAVSEIPPEDQDYAEFIKAHQEDVTGLDVRVFSTLSELMTTFTSAESEHWKVAGSPLDSDLASHFSDPGTAASQIWAIVVDKLAEEEISFPTPETLSDALSLRQTKEVADFRALFFPFIDSIMGGDCEEMKRLRKEVSSSAKAFNRFPRVRKLASYVAYGSLGMGVIEAIARMVGPSIALGAIGLGLERLAKRWEKRGSWIYLSNHEGRRETARQLPHKSR